MDKDDDERRRERQRLDKAAAQVIPLVFERAFVKWKRECWGTLPEEYDPTSDDNHPMHGWTPGH